MIAPRMADEHAIAALLRKAFGLARAGREGLLDEQRHTARKEGGGDPRTDISAIKIFVPAAYHRVVDRAIQVWGAAGVSGDLPLAGMYQGARTLRIADGPDEVHRAMVARMELAKYGLGRKQEAA